MQIISAKKCLTILDFKLGNPPRGLLVDFLKILYLPKIKAFYAYHFVPAEMFSSRVDIPMLFMLNKCMREFFMLVAIGVQLSTFKFLD